VIEGDVSGDPSGPWAEVAVRIKALMGAMDSPEGLDGQILCDDRVADDSSDPAMHRSLKSPKERLEGA
jgi:hypothetical protein